MTSVVAAIWMPPSTMKTPAPMAIAPAVIKTDASSHTSSHPSRSPAGAARSARQNQDDREIDCSVPLDYREPICRPEARDRSGSIYLHEKVAQQLMLRRERAD
jgi:hypothetical protein